MRRPLVIDWRRLRREALEPLRRGTAATYQPYDWEADDGRLAPLRSVAPGDPVILEGCTPPGRSCPT
jgi:hypothetical protein